MIFLITKQICSLQKSYNILSFIGLTPGPLLLACFSRSTMIPELGCSYEMPLEAVVVAGGFEAIFNHFLRLLRLQRKERERLFE